MTEDISEIVRELRDFSKCSPSNMTIDAQMRCAADAIERLSERCDAYKNQVKDGADTIARLSAANEEWSKIAVNLESQIKGLRDDCAAAEARLAEAVGLIDRVAKDNLLAPRSAARAFLVRAKGASDAATGDKVSVPRQLVCDVIQIAGRNEDAQCIRDLADLVLPSSRRVG